MENINFINKTKQIKEWFMNNLYARIIFCIYENKLNIKQPCSKAIKISLIKYRSD